MSSSSHCARFRASSSAARSSPWPPGPPTCASASNATATRVVCQMAPRASRIGAVDSTDAIRANHPSDSPVTLTVRPGLESKMEAVPTRPDFVRLEHEILDFWKRTDAFAKLQQLSSGRPLFRFIDGPITANNPMGVHHAWGRTLKDVFIRYKVMRGHSCRFQNGFDCQGLWVEVEVEKELQRSEERRAGKECSSWVSCSR